MSIEKRARVDIIVPVYKNPALSARCIESLISNFGELTAYEPRLILVNDSPADIETTTLLQRYAHDYSYVALLENHENLGFIKSVNRGLELSLAENRDAILVNSDTQTFACTLSELLAVAYLDSQIAFVSPRSNNASLSSLPHIYGGTIHDPNQSFDNWRDVCRLLPRYHFTPTAVGFYLLIRNFVLAEFGKLREDFGLGYEEENDLILRTNKVGYRSALANHAFAFHAGSASFGLLDFDLGAHQQTNLEKMNALHPEFLPLIRRYEVSAHFFSEKLLSELVGLEKRKIEIVFELTGLAPNHNGTNELAVSIVKNFHKRQAHRFSITAICSLDSFEYHGLSELDSLRRENEHQSGTFAIAVKLGQPFDLHPINLLENIAPINFYAMLDTIAEDCGYLSYCQDLNTLWSHVANYSNGLIFISKFSQRMFYNRYPEASRLSSYTRLLPTKLSCYSNREVESRSRHILVLGNHFAHKDSERTASVLAKAFPRLQIIVLGGNTFERDNLRSFRSGTLTDEKIESLYFDATAVVFPSFVEGFGLGIVHALARKKLIFARRIPATQEILSSYKSYDGVHLYDDTAGLVSLLSCGSNGTCSNVDDSDSETWEDWVDGLAEFCIDTLKDPSLFQTAKTRRYNADLLRKSYAWDATSRIKDVSAAESTSQAQTVVDSAAQTSAAQKASVVERIARPVLTVEDLMLPDGVDFINQVYASFLKRSPDTAGETFYLNRLRSGESKLQIVDEISSSVESKQHGIVIPGLEDAIHRHRTTMRSNVKKILARALRKGA